MYSYGEGKNSIDYTLQGSSAQSRGGGTYKGGGHFEIFKNIYTIILIILMFSKFSLQK